MVVSGPVGGTEAAMRRRKLMARGRARISLSAEVQRTPAPLAGGRRLLWGLFLPAFESRVFVYVNFVSSVESAVRV
jgi:hypothetical protein